jgi:hypothetical protein
MERVTTGIASSTSGAARQRLGRHHDRERHMTLCATLPSLQCLAVRQMQRRYLQYLAARVFAAELQDTAADFTEEELREEAALRCWLAEANVLGSALPSSSALRALANWYDWQYGEFAWWGFPIYSTCDFCQPCGAPLCTQCESYMLHCALSEGWATTHAQQICPECQGCA